MYSFLKVTTKYGTFEHKNCDYYIQDNMLTVFREERIECTVFDEATYHPYEAHYPMENVVEINCVKDR